MGYQTEVWTRSNRDGKWHQAKVTHTEEELIKFNDTSTSSNTAYQVTLDPNNMDACIMYNSDKSKNWRYWKGEKS